MSLTRRQTQLPDSDMKYPFVSSNSVFQTLPKAPYVLSFSQARFSTSST
jgi:hypothetical protein